MRFVVAVGGGSGRALSAVISAPRTTPVARGSRTLSCRDVNRVGRRRVREYSSSAPPPSSPRPSSPSARSNGGVSKPPSSSSVSTSAAASKKVDDTRDITESTHVPSQSVNNASNDDRTADSDNSPFTTPPTPPPPPQREQVPDPTTPAPTSAGASISAVPASTAIDNTATATRSSSSSTSSRSLRQFIHSSPIGRAADFYSRMQSRRPYWTQLWCTLFIYLCGDLSAQLFVGDMGGKEEEGGNEVNEGKSETGIMARYDPLRTARHLTVGAVACVPGYRWFMFLHNNFNFTSKFISIFTKVAINQAVFTPVFNTYFFSMHSLLAGTSVSDTWERLKLALPTSIKNSAKLWPAVTAFMFMYVDPQFRSIFAGGIAVGWQTYLSWLNQKAARDVRAAEAEGEGVAAAVASSASAPASAPARLVLLFSFFRDLLFSSAFLFFLLVGQGINLSHTVSTIQRQKTRNNYDKHRHQMSQQIPHNSSAVPVVPVTSNNPLSQPPPQERPSPDTPASSDYGSDFSSDEEELLNLLLAKIGEEQQQQQQEATTITTSTATSAAVETVGTIEARTATEEEEITCAEETAPAPTGGVESPVLVVADIEDYEYAGISHTEHPNSLEGREKERRRELEREQEQLAAEKGQSASANENGNTHVSTVDTLSPLDRFRKPPRKALSVTDLVSPAWCELQYWYTLSKFGRKRATPAMKQGTVVHKELEDQVHTTVPIEVMTREDGWALRIWNVIQGLRTLRVAGMTRELEVWGNVDGEIVTGIIDQLSYKCPDPELDASAEAHYADFRTSKTLLPEYQTSINEFFLSPAGGGRRFSDIGMKISELDEGQSPTTSSTTPPATQPKKIYITDIKTRGKTSRSIPSVSSTGFRPTHLQLQLYYHFLNRLVTSDDVTIDAIAARYNLETETPFSDSFIAQIGSLNEEFFDASQDFEDADYSPKSPSNSQDSMTILLEHNSLSRLWKLMKSQLRLTFIPPNTQPASTTTTTSTTPDYNPPLSFQPPSPSPSHTEPSTPTLISPVLTATYITPPDTPSDHMQYLGSRSFLFNPSFLYGYLADEMRWWRGDRQTRGVQVMEAWKCRICEFREECEWRREMEGRLAGNKRIKRGAVAVDAEAAAAAAGAAAAVEGLPGEGEGDDGNEGNEDVAGVGQSVV
ncbi:hypothetical protein AJ79_05707 [Helicocarpus griseus UAMH5409]|uniref:Exonuclease V, mitochondrial n=1 Tax=Helicocarpus griseus UAMH5409 TaxID=1447875 RepID=A0A2B7XKE0_9EURO|nr:hypothetical protein AJ79_05707 [Helicocarpus griseus UAMH5409]